MTERYSLGATTSSSCPSTRPVSNPASPSAAMALESCALGWPHKVVMLAFMLDHVLQTAANMMAHTCELASAMRSYAIIILAAALRCPVRWLILIAW